MNNITLSELIRTEAGLSRAEFSREYNIPLRTLEEWDAGRRQPSDWVIDLLARAVLEDKGASLVLQFDIYEVDENNKEKFLFSTLRYTQAINGARCAAEQTTNEVQVLCNMEGCKITLDY